MAVAAIGIFDNYRESVMDTINDRDYAVIESEVTTAIYNMKDVDSGSFITVDIPQSGQTDYRVALSSGKLRISVGGDTEVSDLQGVNWASGFRGSAESSSVKIMKLNDNIVLRPA